MIALKYVWLSVPKDLTDKKGIIFNALLDILHCN